MPRSQEGLARLVERDEVSARVVDAFRRVAREDFVPRGSMRVACADRPVEIPERQTTSQPSLIARMIDALDLSPEDRVLEVGTGYGYQTALLARLAASVTTIERWPDLAAQALQNLDRHGVGNVRVLTGDGTEGVQEHAPYDAVLVSAAFPEVPSPLVEQLRAGGRLVQPIGAGGREDVVLFERTPEGLVRRAVLCPARFVRLYGRHGYPSDTGDGRPRL